MKMTQSQFNEIVEKLSNLKEKKANAIDSSLNEEYDEYIAELENILADSKVVMPKPNRKAQIGSVCSIISENGAKDLEVELVEKQMLYSDIKRASIASPMGAQLLGSSVGDIISVTGPNDQTTNYQVYGLTNGDITYDKAPQKTRK